MKEIKNVIFDLGGVLVDLDIERCTAAFRELGMPRVADLINPYYPAEMIGRLERGDIPFHEACDEMRRLDGRPEVTDSEIAAAYSAFLVGIPVAKLRQIMRLREAGVRTYVLSNNNPAAMVAIPMMAFMGVRISWLMRERKSRLAVLACCALASASLSVCRVFTSWVRSDRDTTYRMVPAFSFTGYR